MREFKAFQKFKAMKGIQIYREKTKARERYNDSRVSIHIWRSSTTVGKETKEEHKQQRTQEDQRPRDSHEVVNRKEYDVALGELNFRNLFNDINNMPIPVGLKGPRVKPYDGMRDPYDQCVQLPVSNQDDSFIYRVVVPIICKNPR